MPKTVVDIKMYSVAEVAMMMSVTERTIRDYGKTGKLNICKIGTKSYVTEQSLKDYILNKRKTRPQSSENVRKVVQAK